MLYNQCRNEFQRIDDGAALLTIHGTKRDPYTIVSLIDADDIDLIARYPWHRHVSVPIPRVRGRVDGKTIHLSVFLVHPPPGLVVDHIDRNPLNNRRSNLRAVTQSVNITNSDHAARKLNPEKAREIRSRLLLGERAADLAREFGVSQPAISWIKSRRIYADA